MKLDHKLFEKIGRHRVHMPVRGYVLMDIDGCCLFSLDRYKRLEQGLVTYEQYVAEGHNDKPIAMGCVVYAMIIANPHLTPIFNTARRESQREMTELQLEQLFPGHSAALWMRPNDSDLEDEHLKLWQLEKNGIEPREVVLAFDDRPSVCEAYREAGILAYQTDTGY